jgi:thiamine-monophosphate kinase
MKLTEFDIINTYFTQEVQSPNIIHGIGDDAAVFAAPSDRDIIQCVDTLVEGTHFFADCNANSLGHKALAVNLSDIAAMGGAPHSAQLALTLPGINEPWLTRFCDGIFTLAKKYEIDLIGGDLTQGPLTITVVLNGSISKGAALLRSGAQVGDDIHVTGELGAAAYAVQCLKQQQLISETLRKKLERPTPRLTIGQQLQEIATSCIDLSDGLHGDLAKICQASKLGASIRANCIPYAADLKALPLTKQQQLALFGGDDYELCFTAPVDKRDQIELMAKDYNCRITRIGQTCKVQDIIILDNNNNPIKFSQQSYTHFTNKEDHL